MRIAITLLALAALAGCKDKDTENQETGDVNDTSETETDTDTDSDTETDTETDEECLTTVLATIPADGTTDWYYRDDLEVDFSEAAADKATVQLLDPAGAEVPVELTWFSDDTKVSIHPVGWLESLTTYTLHIEVCALNGDVLFTTTEYGSDLADDPANLVERTYVVDFNEVVISQPEGIGAFITPYLYPILIGVRSVDTEFISFAAAIGKKRTTGAYIQHPDYMEDYWDLDPADFTEMPYFAADVGEIAFTYEGADIPVYNFHIEGTFSPDASSFGGGILSGKFDTRQISEEFGGSETWLCEYAGSFGVSCIECPTDGAIACMDILVEDVVAPWEEGLILVDPTPDE